MSNHTTPQVQTNLTITRTFAATVIVGLVVLAVALLVLAVHLFVAGKEHGDLLFTVAGFLTLGLMLIPCKFLFEIAFEAVNGSE